MLKFVKTKDLDEHDFEHFFLFCTVVQGDVLFVRFFQISHKMQGGGIRELEWLYFFLPEPGPPPPFVLRLF